LAQMGLLHHSKCALGLVFGLATVEGCHGGESGTARVLTTHVSPGCPSGGQALDGEGYAKFYGSGDFDPALPAAGHFLKSAGDVLSEIDPASRALVVDASEGAGRWLAVSGIAATGNIDVLLLPWMASCALLPALAPDSAAVVSSGATMGPVAPETVLIAGGVTGTDASQVAAASQVVDLSTGSVASITPDLATPRIQATVTAFGAGGLVAGGRDVSVGLVLDTAEVYSPELGGIDQAQRISLSTYRSDHGAAILVTGETLLVGGVGQDGVTVLSSMEVVDPTTRTVRAENVASLTAARREPVVLHLASGEILVAGGLDASDTPVATVEWFLADVSKASKRPHDLVAGATARSYIALEGGGALAVFAPPAGPPDPSYQSVWVIDADGSFEAGVPVAGTLTQPMLFGGAGGAPILWTGDRWLRWQPWSGSFGAFISLDPVSPSVSGPGSSPDPGAGMWLDPATSALTLMRFDTRGTYSPLAGPLLVTDTSDMAPDSLAGPVGASFDPSLGLVLPPGRSAFVTDRTYADVSIDVDAPTGEPAVVVLRDESGSELEIGGASCPAPFTAGAASSLHVERRSAKVTWNRTTGGAGTCSTATSAEGRLAIGVRTAADATRSVVTNLRVARE
jgi:hypothetical protein